MSYFASLLADQDSTLQIRLEKSQPSNFLDSMSKEEILSQISRVERDQSMHGRSDNYHRYWSPKVEEDDDKETFTVLQFNTLAEGLSFGPKTSPPFQEPQRIQNNNKFNETTSYYGGFNTVKSPEVCFNYEQRRWRLLQTILEVDADIIGLQEVDRFHGFFLPALKKFGYEGIFLPKTNSPGFKMGWYSDGCSLFYRSSKFELLSEKNTTNKNYHHYTTGNQNCIVARLRHRHLNNQVVTVAVTHLKSQQNEECEAIRIKQVNQLLDEFLKHNNDIRTSNSDDDVVVTVNDDSKVVNDNTILLGDFNTELSSELVKKIRMTNLTSAYDNDDSRMVTTWKTRGNNITARRIVDYIFYSAGLTSKSVYSIPFDDIQRDKLPSLRYPSDHVLLSAKFELSR